MHISPGNKEDIIKHFKTIIKLSEIVLPIIVTI